MQNFDVIVVGAGPAGAACSGALHRGGAKVGLFDLATFPRDKLCAGWVTPDVFDCLALSPDDYPHSLIRYDKIQFHYRGIRIPITSTQYSIRRYEFDSFLVERSGVVPIKHRVREIAHEDGYYVVDGKFRAPRLVGAGGTRCPVYRRLFAGTSSRPKTAQIVALEKEFAFDWSDSRCHLFFFDQGLTGYSWYVPKAGGYLNCGVGGLAEAINGSSMDIRAHWNVLLARLVRLGVPAHQLEQPSGYSYFLRSAVKFGHLDGAYLIGDAAGLATRDLGEGIGPAVHRGYLAAHAIAQNTDYRLEDVYAYSPIKVWLSNWLDGRWKKSNVNAGLSQ